jgi:hypothetical protein
MPEEHNIKTCLRLYERQSIELKKLCNTELYLYKFIFLVKNVSFKAAMLSSHYESSREWTEITHVKTHKKNRKKHIEYL